MTDIGSLGVDSTLRYFMHGAKYCHGVLVPPSIFIECPVLHQEQVSLQKICTHEKHPSSQQAHHLSLYPNYERTTAVLLLLLLLNGLYVLPTVLQYERALYCCTTTAYVYVPP